ncbi:MAG: deoxyribose-phosphate aldolase [Synechococcales cyanobacterium]
MATDRGRPAQPSHNQSHKQAQATNGGKTRQDGSSDLYGIPMTQMTDLAPYLEAELLNPSLSLETIQQFCLEADRFRYAAVCIHPWDLPSVKEWLYQRHPQIAVAIGFPLGLQPTLVKLFEAQWATDQGATELDVVINAKMVNTQQWDPLYQEVAGLVEATHLPVKAILDMGLIDPANLETAVDVCLQSGVSFLKGASSGVASVAHVRTLARLSQGKVGIKASGGIKTATQVYDLLEAGATRIGTTYGQDILSQWQTMA